MYSAEFTPLENLLLCYTIGLIHYYSEFHYNFKVVIASKAGVIDFDFKLCIKYCHLEGNRIITIQGPRPMQDSGGVAIDNHTVEIL